MRIAVLDPRGQLLRAAVGFAGLPRPSYDRALHALRSWLDSWSGIGHVVVGMARQGYDLQLTRYNEKGWRATFYTTGMEHSPTNATGTEWEHAVARDAAGGVGSSEKGRDLMALKITGFSMWLHVLPAQLLIDYTPLTPI